MPLGVIPSQRIFNMIHLMANFEILTLQGEHGVVGAFDISKHGHNKDTNNGCQDAVDVDR